MEWEEPSPAHPSKKGLLYGEPIPDWVKDQYLRRFNNPRFYSSQERKQILKILYHFGMKYSAEGVYRASRYWRAARRRAAAKIEAALLAGIPYSAIRFQDRWLAKANLAQAPTVEPVLALHQFPARMGRHHKQPILTRDQLESPYFEASIVFKSEERRLDAEYEAMIRDCSHHWESRNRKETHKICKHCGLIEVP
jgi:hypothetical protein